VFSLEITAFCLTISHFLHVWFLHGTAGLSLVDGVLALHLHSTISLIGKKIAERRNMHRVTREINNSFPDASDLDIRKASAAGDVCCICLNSLLVGGVKKIACGHLFHTNCLREVLERERSFASAKCPLCRASVVTGRHDLHVVHHVGAVGAGVGNRRAQPAQLINQQLNTGEQSLLRFSTENLLPSWLPIPAFAFEVVRREATVVVEPTPNPEAGWQRFFRRGGQVQGEDVNDDGNNHLQPQGQQESSFWRRVLILVGAIPMSPEEEAVALEQLVDMFPQVR
jgi:Zn ribbon nucleic-acid-binding protein